MLYIGGSSRVLSLYGGGYLYTVQQTLAVCLQCSVEANSVL